VEILISSDWISSSLGCGESPLRGGEAIFRPVSRHFRPVRNVFEAVNGLFEARDGESVKSAWPFETGESYLRNAGAYLKISRGYVMRVRRSIFRLVVASVS
jgi:hypothetical protein